MQISLQLVPGAMNGRNGPGFGWDGCGRTELWTPQWGKKWGLRSDGSDHRSRNEIGRKGNEYWSDMIGDFSKKI